MSLPPFFLTCLLLGDDDLLPFSPPPEFLLVIRALKVDSLGREEINKIIYYNRNNDLFIDLAYCRIALSNLAMLLSLESESFSFLELFSLSSSTLMK